MMAQCQGVRWEPSVSSCPLPMMRLCWLDNTVTSWQCTKREGNMKIMLMQTAVSLQTLLHFTRAEQQVVELYN
jgi:hypothetical protein